MLVYLWTSIVREKVWKSYNLNLLCEIRATVATTDDDNVNAF